MFDDVLTSHQTKQRTLEEIAAAFGDKVVDVKDQEVPADAFVPDDKNRTSYVEGKA